MKIVVFGGAGNVTFPALKHMVDQADIAEIVLADINNEALENRRKELNDDRVKVEVVDLNKQEQIVKALKGATVCLNGSYHTFNIPIMKACIEEKVNYTDFGGFFHWARKQMELHDDFKKEGITAIVGSGSSPGYSNVMAKYAVDQLDTVETVEIQNFIVNLNNKGYDFVPSYSLNSILDEFTFNYFEYKNGEFIENKPFLEEEVVELPEPFGKKTLHKIIHTEVATMPVTWKNKGIKNVSYKISLDNVFMERVRFLIENGLASKDPINVDGVLVSPRKFLVQLIETRNRTKAKDMNVKPNDHKLMRVIVHGEKFGKKITYTIEAINHPYEPWNMSMGKFTVGVPAAVTTLMLGRGQVQNKGVFPGEAAIDTQIYFEELAKRGWHITCKTSQDIT